jgi:hypothetical protein
MMGDKRHLAKDDKTGKEADISIYINTYGKLPTAGVRTRSPTDLLGCRARGRLFPVDMKRSARRTAEEAGKKN